MGGGQAAPYFTFYYLSWAGKILIGALTTPTYALFRIKSPEEDLFPLRKKDFSGFFPEPFFRVITTAAIAIITATPTAIIIIITTTSATAISGTPTKVKLYPLGRPFKR